MYFYYAKNVFGKWSPQTSEDAPEKSVNGGFAKFAGVRKLDEDETALSLGALARKYPVDAEAAPSEKPIATITRAASPLDGILGEAFPVLDHGFVRVVDYMGNDASIVQMARVSYGEGTKTPSDDRGLIRYLMRNDHTSPFEGCEIKLHVKLPIFVARQWIRHRTANVNEYSGRYSILKDEFYLPPAERLGRQSTTNKQGTGAGYTEGEADQIRQWLVKDAEGAFMTYGELTCEQIDLSRELARINLPLSTYTEWYWKIDLHNLFHFLRLRADPHAQKEIRDYAAVIEHIVRTWVPDAFEAYVDYRRDAVKFSRMEAALIREVLGHDDFEERELLIETLKLSGASDREALEFCNKIGWKEA